MLRVFLFNNLKPYQLYFMDKNRVNDILMLKLFIYNRMHNATKWAVTNKGLRLQKD